MTDYRMLFADLRTGVLLGELPVETCEAEHVLNSPGSIRASMPLSMGDATRVLSPQVPTLELDASTFGTARTALFLEREGVIQWGGVMWTRRINVDTEELEVGGEGWLSYWRHRYLLVRKVYTAVDQVLIAKDLLDWGQTMMSGDRNHDTSGVVATGVLRDRTYEQYEYKNIAEAIEQLSAVEDGFDFAFTSQWSGSDILTRFLTAYPATGRATDIVLEVGVNIDVLEWTEDGTSVAHVAYAIGGGEGVDQLSRTAIDVPSLLEYPRLEAVESHTDVRETATLYAHAQRRLRRGLLPIDTMRVELDPNVVPVLGSYAVGDIVRVRGYLGAMDVDQSMRVTAMSIHLDADGGEAVQADLANVGVF